MMFFLTSYLKLFKKPIYFNASRNKIDAEKNIEMNYATQAIAASLKVARESKGCPQVNEHLKNVFETGEIDSAGTIKEFRIVQNNFANFTLSTVSPSETALDTQ
jgi:hypothetical protein